MKTLKKLDKRGMARIRGGYISPIGVDLMPVLPGIFRRIRCWWSPSYCKPRYV